MQLMVGCGTRGQRYGERLVRKPGWFQDGFERGVFEYELQ